MAVPLLLLETLEGLSQKDLKKFQWGLVKGISDSGKPIHLCHLENADQMDTVNVMTQQYGEELAVNVTVEILKKINKGPAAEILKKKYAAGGETAVTSTSAAAPAAAAMMAQHGGVNIAPSVAHSTIQTLNINYNNSTR